MIVILFFRCFCSQCLKYITLNCFQRFFSLHAPRVNKQFPQQNLHYQSHGIKDWYMLHLPSQQKPKGAPPMPPQDKALRDYWPFVSGVPTRQQVLCLCLAVLFKLQAEKKISFLCFFFGGGKFKERRRGFVVFNCNYWYQDMIYFCVWVCSLIYFKFQPDFWTVNHEALDMCTQKCLQETGWCCSYVFSPFWWSVFYFGQVFVCS